MIFPPIYRGKGRDREQIAGGAGWRTVGFAAAIAIGIGLACPAGLCECLYRWTDNQGGRWYSNVGPPPGHRYFEVVTMGGRQNPVPREVPAGGAIGPPDGGKGAAPSAGGFEAGMHRLLARRIAERKKEIRAIEALLVKRRGNERLRRALRRKKRYLEEDLRQQGACLQSRDGVCRQESGKGGRHDGQE